MTVPQEIFGLVGRFENNREAYRSGAYNETQLRREFVDPLFKILGWDVNNEKGYAEAYKDVIHEDSIKVGGVTKAPDYCFRIGGTRKFFVETKKPSVNLKDDISPAFQLRRYAWSAKLPLSILTDFEEFAVYDCRAKPDKSDKASTARILYLNCNEYAQRWDEIFEIFSRDAVLKGSFDKYAESSKVKKGTAEVDDAFLKEIESWRDTLARNLALRNPELSQRDLNFSVQRTIDRIVFLRICEDRGMEQYGRLMTLQNGDRVYERLCEMFYRADERYNSGLFHFQKEKSRAESPDTLTIGLIIDDKPLKDIIKNLYYPDSPYEFSVLSADILGQVYEQFLGKVIRLTEGHRAVVEEKPEVRKAGGVYYTPTYIVDYIVKNTIGQFVNSKIQNQKSKMKGVTPKEISKICILDPACGSGSFLLGAYQYLLDWHRDWYVANEPEKWATGKTPALYQSGKSEVRSPKSETDIWRLTTAERRRILLNNIYGVDIDPQAVEVTKLSLLLKVLEGESEQTIARQLKLFHERALPDLSNNIKCGNSLIGPNFYEGGQMSLFDDEERYRINVFDWEKEFHEIMKNGGFDVVIGNPPYSLIGSDRPEEQLYFKTRFDLTIYKINTYLLFLEKGLKLLGKNGSILGYIIPKSLVFNTYFTDVRAKLLTNYAIPKIVEIREKVFEKAEVGDSILFFGEKKVNPGKNVLTYYIVRNVFPDFEILEEFQTEQTNLLNDEEPKFFKGGVIIKTATKLLDTIAIVSNGLNPGNVRHILLSTRKETSNHHEMVLGRDIQRYSINWSGTWVNYDKSFKDRLKVSDTKSKKGMTAQKKVDFALRSPEIYTPNKILVRKTADRIIASFDLKGLYFDSLSYGIHLRQNQNVSILYLLGLLNSRFLNYLHDALSLNKDKAFAKVLAENIKKLPVRTINFSDLDDKALHDRMVALVDQMLELHKQSASAKTDHDKTVIQRQIGATDRQIDRLVYELYGLTEEEIKIVEKGST